MTYEEFINNILETRGRFACGDEYHERHHIVPRCMGGGNEEENLIDLFAREHFEAHRLLALENPDEDGLVYSWFRMSFGKNQDRITHIVTAEEYEEARKAHSELQKKRFSGENNPMYGVHRHGEDVPFYGKHHTEETRQRLSEIRTGSRSSDDTRKKISEAITGEGNPMYGKHHTEKTKMKISKALKGKPLMEETRKKIGEALKGRRHTKETRKKIGEAQKGEKHHGALKVVQCHLDGSLIKVWAYIEQAANSLGIQGCHISKCCKGKVKTVGGYQWKYLYDQTQKDGTVIPGAITLGLITEKEALRMLEEQKEAEGENENYGPQKEDCESN